MKGSGVMTSRKRKNEDSGFGQDFIIDEYRRKEKKLMDNSCITGERIDESDESDEKEFGFARKRRLISWLTTFSLVLGFLVFLFLWFNKV